MRHRADDTAATPVTEPSERRRENLDEVRRLGALYSFMNYFTPLVRLWAIFAFVHSPETRGILAPVMGAIVASIANIPLGKIISPPVADSDAANESSASAQARVISRQGVRLGLLAAGTGVGSLWVDRELCGLRFAADGEPALELGAGMAAAAVMAIVWSFVAASMPREPLTVSTDGGTENVSSATEDELLRQMPPSRRAASLFLRCAAVGLGCYADVLLLLVFLPSRLDAVASLLSASLICVGYGSQHLRFRNEWVLGTCYGAALFALRAHFDSRLPAPLAAAAGFSMFRQLQLRRSHDEVRRFHGQ